MRRMMVMNLLLDTWMTTSSKLTFLHDVMLVNFPTQIRVWILFSWILFPLGTYVLSMDSHSTQTCQVVLWFHCNPVNMWLHSGMNVEDFLVLLVQICVDVVLVNG